MRPGRAPPRGGRPLQGGALRRSARLLQLAGYRVPEELVPHSEAGFKLGSALFSLNRHADAAAQWDRRRRQLRRAPRVLYWSGVALEKAGNKAEAAKRLEQLVTQREKHPG